MARIFPDDIKIKVDVEFNVSEKQAKMALKMLEIYLNKNKELKIQENRNEFTDDVELVIEDRDKEI
jgi:hypothetical protein